MRDRETKDSDSYIDLYLLKPVDLIFRALRLFFFDGSFLTGFRQGAPSPCPFLGNRWPLSEPLDCSNLFWLPCWPFCAWVPVYIQFQNTYTSGKMSFRLSNLVMCFRLSMSCSLVHRAEICYLEIASWRACQRSICNAKTLEYTSAQQHTWYVTAEIETKFPLPVFVNY